MRVTWSVIHMLMFILGSSSIKQMLMTNGGLCQLITLPTGSSSTWHRMNSFWFTNLKNIVVDPDWAGDCQSLSNDEDVLTKWWRMLQSCPYEQNQVNGPMSEEGAVCYHFNACHMLLHMPLEFGINWVVCFPFVGGHQSSCTWLNANVPKIMMVLLASLFASHCCSEHI